MSNLWMDLERLHGSFKHGFEMDPSEARPIIRRAQHRIEELEELLSQATLPGAAVLAALEEDL